MPSALDERKLSRALSGVALHFEDSIAPLGCQAGLKALESVACSKAGCIALQGKPFALASLNSHLNGGVYIRAEGERRMQPDKSGASW